MSEKTVTGQFAAYAAMDHFQSFSQRDIRMAKLCMLDWIAAAYTGIHEDCVCLLRELSEEEQVKGDCCLIGQKHYTSPETAALINGTASHAIDFDDIHDFLSLHLCSPVLPAVLAVAEYEKADGRQVINGIMNGMQIMVAISAGIMPEHYNIGHWHATGTIGIFGAAAAAGAVMKLTEDQMNNAFGVCAGLCSGIQLNFGTMAKPLAAGIAAKNGLMAAMLAKRGFTGKKDIFDTDFLSLISAGKQIDPDAMLTRLYGPYGVHELRFKRYPCGAPTHSGIINCKKILQEHPHEVEEIEKIIFEPYPRAIRLVGNRDPKTGLEGKFSISYTAAAQIVFGEVTIESFTDEKVHDPRVQYLLPRMELVACDEFTPSRGGRATMYFKDGTSYSHETYLLGHELDLEEAQADVIDKYREIMEPRTGGNTIDKILQKIKNLETLDQINELSMLL